MNDPKLSIKQMTQKNEDNTPIIINQGDDNVSDEISKLAIGELLNKKKLKSVSRIKFEQVSILSKLYLFADVFQTSFTKKLADNILELQISTNGLGRRDMVQMVQRRDTFFDISNGMKPQSSKDIFR